MMNFAPYPSDDGPNYTIAGIAGDVKNEGLANQGDPELYMLRGNHHPETWDQHHIFVLETALPASVIAPFLRTEIARLDATAPVEINSLNQDVTKLADRPRFETALLGFFAACGVLMSIVGLYGVIAYVATQRTHEIGVRMALGASKVNVLWLIASEGIRLIALGGFLGIVVALAASQLLKNLMFHIGPHDPATYCTVAGLISLVALAATLIPARGAMKVEPVVALRDE
jgi:putative ABC transport system permease protein